MKKIILSVFLAILLLDTVSAAPNLVPESSYLGLEFTKPYYDFFTVKTENGGTHISFGNPKNDGTDLPVTRSFTVEYRLQSPGTLFIFFSGKNDLGYDAGKGSNSNPWMLEAKGRPGCGLNYYVSATSNPDWGGGKTDQTLPLPKGAVAGTPPYLIDESFTKPEYIDIGTAPGNSSKVTSGLVVRHLFTRDDIDKGISKNSSIKDNASEAEKLKKGFATGIDTITLTMDVNNLTPAPEGGEVHLKSGLYYGYIVVHFKAD